MSSDPRAEAVYPIRVIAEKTGVNPVTLRAWERRYGLVKPERTAKGHRLYSAGDVTLIKRILTLLDQGVSISRVRELLQPRADEVPAQAPAGDAWNDYRRRMLTAVSRFDERALEATYSDALSLYPVDMVTRLLVQPLLDELDRRWQSFTHADAERGFVHSYLRNKLGARFHQQALQSNGPRLVLAGMPGDTAETPLLLLALALLTGGYRVLLLGAGCRLEALAHALARSEACALVLHAELMLPGALLEGALPRLSAELATPVFAAGAAAVAQAVELRRAGLVVLPADAASAVQQVRETLS